MKGLAASPSGIPEDLPGREETHAMTLKQSLSRLIWEPELGTI